MIPDHLVEEVRARADLVEIIGEHITLKRAGKEFRALCPFHHEKTPSFHVVPSKGFYKCFGCGESGDAFAFLMKREGLGFQDAVRHIATRVGVEIPEHVTRGTEEPNRALYEAVAFAAEFYHQQLWEKSTGERARAYLVTRELTQTLAERITLGYAPEGWRTLREAAHRHGMDDQVLLDAGLIKKSEKSEEPYDRLRDRLIFPIADLSGRWIAFGGRIVGRASEGVAKYLNSPETAIFQKGRSAYGLNWSRNAIRRENTALVVEGFMDYVSLAARGVEHVVAGLGTALTAEQAVLLARYTRKAHLLYDSDAAGLKATFKAGDQLLRAGVEPLVVMLPAGEDPDSLVRKGGAAALAPHLAKAVDVLDRKLQILAERGYLEHSEGMRLAVDRLLPTLRAAADPALKDIYVARVAQRTGVRRETLERELTNDRPFRGVVTTGRERGRPSTGYSKQGATGHSQARARADAWASERLLLLLMLRDVERIAHAARVIEPDEFRESEYRELYQAMLAHGALPDEPPATFDLSVSARQCLSELRADPLQIADGDRVFDETVVGIKSGGLRMTLDELDARMSVAGAEEQAVLYREKQRITAEQRQLDVSKSRLGWRDTRQGRKGRKRPSPGGNG
ncbi:MAG: DNA primase [Longimicrobiales bacterium]